jgi:Domain of unknown function (DUF4397)
MTVQRLLSLVGAAALASAFMAVAITPAHGASNATVSVLHGVPDATVDVYANGKALLEDFEPGTLTDPQMLPAGSYDLKVVKAGDGPDGDAIMSANNVKVPAGANVTVVAHLSDSGKPTLTPYANDVSSLPAGKARVIVRHNAAAPEVDVRAGGEPVFTDLANPKEESAEIDPGTIKADVVLAGSDDVVIGPASLKVKAPPRLSTRGGRPRTRTLSSQFRPSVACTARPIAFREAPEVRPPALPQHRCGQPW